MNVCVLVSKDPVLFSNELLELTEQPDPDSAEIWISVLSRV